MDMIHLDLFSGIGGFALAFDRVFNETKNTHIFCEIDPFCQEVIKKHWPGSIIIDDVRVIADARSPKPRRLSSDARKALYAAGITDKPFLLTGGFPCQPFSQAGRRKGTEDDRHLWPFMFETIRNWKPTWVIAENVRGLLTINQGMVFEQVCIDLEAAGYEVQPLIIPAVSLNAPHRRDRVWFIAHASSGEHRGRRGQAGKENGIQEVGGAQGHIRGTGGADKTHSDDANSKRTEHTRNEHQKRQSAGHCGRPQWDKNWFEVATALCRVDDGIPRRLDRNPRLKALGNAIVPQVAEEIMRAIKLT